LRGQSSYKRLERRGTDTFRSLQQELYNDPFLIW